MANSSVIEKIYDYLGKNKNSATIISCLIAVFKGTFRPIFTMTDKSQDPKTKKFAAIREGITEVAALPLYAGVPTLAGWAVKKFYKGKLTDRVETNAKFLGVLAATIIIPFVCNVIQPPIMNAIKKHADAKDAMKNPVQPQFGDRKKDNPVAPKIATFSASRANYGMKVGG